MKLPLSIRAHRRLGAVLINVWVGSDPNAVLGIRLGRPTSRLFSERHQGQFGIPVRWHYALGGRIGVRTR